MPEFLATAVVRSVSPWYLLTFTDVRLGAKKLRCSGEHPVCSRCSSGNHECTYSCRLKMGRPRSMRISRQGQLRPETSHATPPPSNRTNSTTPTTHCQETPPIRRASGEHLESSDRNYQSTSQGSIPRLFDITSEVTSETPYLDHIYHMYGRESHSIIAMHSCLFSQLTVTASRQISLSYPHLPRPF